MSRPICTCVAMLDFLLLLAILKGRLTCDLQVLGSSPGGAPLHSDLSKLLTPVCLRVSCIFWYWPKGGGDFFVWESNHGPGGK